MTDQVISANRLSDGVVVYLTTDGGWDERIVRARVIADKQQRETVLDLLHGAVENCLVVDPYFINIDDGNRDRQPTLNRELIRARGPTVRLDIGKQAEQ